MKPKSTLRSLLTFTAGTLLAVSYTHAANFTWDPANTGNGATIDPGDGTWNLTVPANIVWNDAGTNKVWAAANVAIFGGADGTYAVTLGEALSAQKIRFANSGYTLSAASALAVTITQGGASGQLPGLAFDSGKSATIGNNVSVLGANTFYLGADNGTAGGTLNIESGATIGTSASASSVVIDGAGTIVNVKTGGTLRLASTGNSTGSAAIVAGQLANSNATLNVQGGNVLVNNSATGSLTVGNSGRGTVTLTNGTIEVLSTASNGVTFGNNALNVSSNVLNLDGGTLTTRVVRKGAGTGSTATFNFNGGTLTANFTNATFMQGLNTANVKVGGAIIDTQAFNITIAQALLNDGGGGLTKNGSGALTLAGANTYSGATAVSAGKLKLSSAGTSASNVTVASAASGGALVAATDAQHVSSANLSLDNGSNLLIDYGTTVPSATVAPLQVANFTLGTGIDLEIEGSIAPVAGPVYPLVKWTGTGPANASAFNPLTLPSGLEAQFAIDTPNKTLTVTFVAPPAISWNTGNGTWDTVPGNTVWLNAALASVAYVDSVNKVLFGDAAGAGTDPVVTLNSALTPLGVTMNSTSRNYTISGSGGIGGVAGITLEASNTRTHTITTANTYTGPTAVNGGVLRLGDGGANGSLAPASAISVASGATFEVNQSDNVTQGTEFGAISGDGGYTQTGGSAMVPGNTVLNLVNTFTGPISIAKGNLEIGANGQLGGGTYTGTINIALAASALQYGSTLSQTLSGAIGGPGSLAKTGSGTLTLSGANTFTGSTTVSQGILALADIDALTTTSAINLGGASAATLSSSLTGITLTAPINTANTGVNSTIAFGRSTNEAGTLTLNGAIGGPGNVIFSTSTSQSANFLQSIDLGAAGTYAGSTTITTQTDNNTLRVRNTSGAADVLPSGTVLTLDGGAGPGGNFTRTVSYDLNGKNQTLAGLTNIARTKRNQTITNGGVDLATLTINNGTDFNYGGAGTNGTVSWSTVVSGNLALTKTGTAKFTLVGTHTYSGNTTVTQGILSLDEPNASNETSTVTIAASGATLDLDFGGTDTVDQLFFGATQQPAGNYSASSVPPGATIPTSKFTGAGTLFVSTGAVSSPYNTWATAKGLTGLAGSSTDPAKTADPDNDGRNNLAEFAFNGNPLSGSDNGQVYVLTEDTTLDVDTNRELILTIAVRSSTPAFAGSPSPSAVQVADGITYSIEGSVNLAGFPTTVNVLPAPITTGLPSAGLGYEYRSFSLDGSNGLTGRGFLRAKVTSP